MLLSLPILFQSLTMPSSQSSTPSGLKMRVRLELKKEIEILNYLATGKKQIEAAKHFGVPRGTISSIFKEKNNL